MPGVKIGNQWRFRKAMLDTWLDDQMLGVTPHYFDVSRLPTVPRRMLDLESCFAPAQIIPNLSARKKPGVIDQLAAFAKSLRLVRDKTWFVGALIERENIMPERVR